MPGAVAKKKRKDELSQEDRFLHFIEGASAWVQLHTRAVIFGIIALVVVVVGIGYYRSYKESLRTRAAIELNQLRASLTLADAVPRLTGFVARYDGTPSAEEGRVMLARMHYQAGRPRDVLEVLGPLSSKPVDHPIGYVTATLLAEAYKDAGEPDRALRKLDEIADGAYVSFQRRRALAEKGRLLAELGRYEEAAGTYRLLVADGTPDDLYGVRLGELEALLASGADPSGPAFAAPELTLPEDSADAGLLAPESAPSQTTPPATISDTASRASPPDSLP